MKNALAVTGLAIMIAMLLSSPTFAQNANPQPDRATAAPAEVIHEAHPADAPLDLLIEEASTTEDRAKLLLRCIGPAPRSPHAPKGAEKSSSSDAGSLPQ